MAADPDSASYPPYHSHSHSLSLSLDFFFFKRVFWIFWVIDSFKISYWVWMSSF